MNIFNFWKRKKDKSDLTSSIPMKDGYPIITHDHKQYLEEKKMLVNYPVGSDVICISNNNSPYKRGKIVNYVAITQARQLTPEVKFEGDDETWICMGILRHYSKELCSALDKLEGFEQWNVLAEFHKISK